MLMNAKSIIFVLAFTFLFAGCQKSVFQSLKKTDDLFVYEGLPHPLRENLSRRKEQERCDANQESLVLRCKGQAIDTGTN